MNIAYLDCTAGISGRMLISALLDLGLPQTYLLSELNKLPFKIPEIVVQKVNKNGINSTMIEISEIFQPDYITLGKFKKLINDSLLDIKVKETASSCINHLFEAEADVSGVSINELSIKYEKVEDIIIDIIGIVVGIEYFKFHKIVCSPIRIGTSLEELEIGGTSLSRLATVHLLKGFLVYGGEFQQEWTTPVGAALIKTFVEKSSTLPSMVIRGVGYGAGTNNRKDQNVLRIISGTEQSGETSCDYQIVLETNIDDMNPEIYGYLGEKLLEAGVKDYFFTPIYMKKNRPATKVSVILDAERVSEVEKLIFRETTSLGVRKVMVQRSCMQRNIKIVEVNGKPIRVKVAKENGKTVKFSPEYEDCLQAAKELGKPIREIYEEAGWRLRDLMEVEG